MVAAHIRAGALAGIQPDSLEATAAPAVEATRLGIYALVRLGSYDALAAATLDAQASRSRRWWPVAYALQRSAIRARCPRSWLCCSTPGRYTAAFAARGLTTLKAAAGAGRFDDSSTLARRPRAVMIQAIRALAALADAASVAALAANHRRSPAPSSCCGSRRWMRFGAAGTRGNVDLLLDLLSDSDAGDSWRRDARAWRGSIPTRSFSRCPGSTPTATGRFALPR